MEHPTTQPMSIRERALQRGRTPASETIHVDEWGCDVEVREIPADQRARALSNAISASGAVQLDKLYPVLVLHGAYDPETGERVFEDADRDELMGGTQGGAIDTIASAAMRVNGLTSKAVESAEGN